MTFAIFTLGCKVNSYESEAVKLLMVAHGHLMDELHPDVAIINTCSVTSMSEKKSRQLIRRLGHDHPDIIIALMGCYAQLAATVLKTLPHVGIVVGTSHRHLIPDLIERFVETKTQQISVEPRPLDFSYEDLKVTTYTDRTRAYVKIQDGCDNFCSYCIIPYARGRLRSRDQHDIIDEIKHLTETGFKEIVLTGIHTAGYGRDFQTYSFDDLLSDIFRACPLLHRLRISSIEASEISERFLTLLAQEPRLAQHLHIPLQSGSDNILAKMNRPYRVADFVKTINRIRQMAPDMAITTDIIVGFPGETEIDFENTYNLSKELGFSKIHVFPFSPRAGTAAARLKDAVHEEMKKQRVHRLIDLSTQLEKTYADYWNGKPVEVILEEYDPKLQAFEGHTSHYLKVFVSGSHYHKGEIVSVIYQADLGLANH